jgi:drug/metabolite transporter (DMT)-like permease
MQKRDRLDAFGVSALFAVALLLAFNQIIVKWVNEGLQPVFFAGARSALAILFVGAWLWWRGRPPVLRREHFAPGLLIGTVFAAEFLCLFLALDLTAVSRAAVIFYSMPVWFALMAHFLLPGERLTWLRATGLALAFAGTALAILSGAHPTAGQGANLTGDLLALGGAFGWAATAMVARTSRLSEAGAEMQLFWMVLVSAPILLIGSLFFGPVIRDLQPQHIVGLVFQSSIVVAGGFIGWLWLLSVYPPSTVASFSFLTPVLAVLLGVIFFDESLTPALLAAAALVGSGIVLINRR